MKMVVLGRRGVLLGAAAGLVGAAETAIPIDISSGQCRLPVLLDGHLAHMVLDTGAERSVVTRAGAARLGLPPDPWVSTTLRGAGGLLDTHANADARSASAGGVTLFQERAGLGLSLPVINADLGDADGLLGGDVLRHFTVALDVPAARLMLLPPATRVEAAGAVQIGILRRTLLLAPVRLDGHKLIALVDTGASLSMVNARGLYRLGLPAAQTPGERIVPLPAIGGTSPARLHRFAELQIGALTVAAPLMLAAAVPEPAYDMTLGLDILGRQRLIISYAQQTLVLEPQR